MVDTASDYDTQEYNYTTSSISEVAALWPKSYDGNASQTPVKMLFRHR